MNYLFAFCVFSIALTAINGASVSSEIRTQTWGYAGGPTLVEERIDKTGVPFITRSTTVEYPGDGVSEKDATIVYGIEIVDFVPSSKECANPTVEFKEGQIGLRKIRIKVESQRGCALNVNVKFYGLSFSGILDQH